MPFDAFITSEYYKDKRYRSFGFCIELL